MRMFLIAKKLFRAYKIVIETFDAAVTFFINKENGFTHM